MASKLTADTGPDERELLVFGEKTFKIRVPNGAKLTFGPFSPPTTKESAYNRSDGDKKGTLRVYEGTNVIAVFSGVSGYRDTSLEYMEQVLIQQGETVWKDDLNGYSRSSSSSGVRTWVDPSEEPKQISEGKKKSK